MHIEELRLSAFGPFTDCCVNLCPGFNILYGPNEAGKSSALRAVRSVLYGIDSRTSDNFVHNYGQLRLGGFLKKRDGKQLEFVRRKGNKHTLRDSSDDKPLDDRILDSFLGAVDEDFFLSVFGIDHEMLRHGGEEVLRGGGKIGELLFSAAGVSDLREHQQAIDAAEGELFKSSGHKPKVNEHVTELHELRGELKKLQASSEVWARYENEAAQLLKRREGVESELSGKEAEVGRLRRILTALPSLSRWKSENAELQLLGDGPLLPDDFLERQMNAQQRLGIAQDRKRAAKEKRGKLQAALALEVVPTELLAEGSVIDVLNQRLGSHLKAKQDRGGLVTTRQNARQNAREILRQLERSDSLEDIESHRVADDKQAMIRGLANRFEAVMEKRRTALRIVERTKAILKDFELQSQQCEPPRDSAALRDTLNEVQSDRDIEAELAEQQEAVTRLDRDIKTALERLPLWSGDLDELDHTSVPSVETIEQFEDTLRTIESRNEAIDKQEHEAQSELEKLEQEKADIEQGDEVPTEVELANSRKLRDEGWQLVRADWKDGTLDDADLQTYLAECGESSELANAFESSMRDADVVADRLRREADRVAKKSQLDQMVHSTRKRLESLAEQKRMLNTERSEQERQWEARWQESSLSPLTPREMRPWLRAYNKALQLGRELNNSQAVTERLGRRCQQSREKLLAVLKAYCSEDEIAEKSLRELIDFGHHQIEALQSEKLAYDQLHKDLERAQRELAEAKEEAQVTDSALTTWKVDWAAAMELLGFEEEVTVEQAESVLANLGRLFEEHREAEQFDRRIYGIDQDKLEFQEDLRNLTGRVTPELEERPLEEAIPELCAQVLVARETQQRAESLREQLDEQESKLAEAETSVVAVTEELQAMCLEAECAQASELAEAGRHSRSRRQLQESITALTSQLQSLSMGLTIEAFAEDAAAENPNELEPRITMLEEEITGLRGERDELLQSEQRVRDELQRIDGNSQAAEKAVECELLITELEEEVEEYTVTRVAGAILRLAVERYREKAQGPILGRASEVYRSLTCGSFEGLRADFDSGGEPMLVGVRPDGKGTLGVEGMSEGARDQLYLALRIATLEHWFEHHEPVPFIVDDILVSFDDMRAEAALRVLAELSKKTQIIFFTHHDHLVSIAKGAIVSVLEESEFLLSTDWVLPAS